jgi:hypothetical protein
VVAEVEVEILHLLVRLREIVVVLVVEVVKQVLLLVELELKEV